MTEPIFIQSSNKECTSYPVGVDMVRNTGIFKALIEGFLTIEEFKGKHINLICTGSSGVIAATIFAMNIPNPSYVSHIKKEGEQSHDMSVWIKRENAINVIVDDFISSGETINKIINRMKSKLMSDFKLDCICVSGMSRHEYLIDQPKYFVCGEISYKEK